MNLPDATRRPLPRANQTHKEGSRERQIAIAAALAATLIGRPRAAAPRPTPPRAPPSMAPGKTIKVWLNGSTHSPAGRTWSTRPPAVHRGNPRHRQGRVRAVGQPFQRLDTASPDPTHPMWSSSATPTCPSTWFNGAFADIDKSKFENSSTWLTGLSDPCTLDGKTYCVPYYAAPGAHLPDRPAQQVGPDPADDLRDLLTERPSSRRTTRATRTSRLLHARCLLVRGHVVGLRPGGQSPKEGLGRQVGRYLEQPAAITGLQQWADLTKTYSKGDRPRTRTTGRHLRQGHAAFLYGNGWETGAVQSQHKDPNDPNSAMVDTR